MKKILFAALLAPMLATAQDQNQNYIKTTSYKLPTATALTSPSPAQASQSITYFDGLGRPVQQVAGRQSSEGKDIVTHIEYDAFGRQAKEYLPYPSANTALEFTSPQAALQATLSHYQSAYGDANPFSEKLFEASPLNRVLQQAAPGNDWAMGNGHEVKIDYQTNATADAVKLYIATAGAPSGGYYPVSLSQTASYPPGVLYKTVTKDENWTSGKGNTTEEYKNKEGQVVLKRTYDMVRSRGGLIAKPHDTYYVYDQYGNLSFVLPPLSDGSGSQQDLAGLCYQYRYDYRNRLVEKKLPGKQWEFIIYDKLDRAIATGPSLHPFGNGTEGWLFTKYDVFGRAAYTGWYNGHQANSVERNNLQILANGATILSESRISNSSIDNISIGYGNTAFPTASFYLLSASYYDNYDFPNAGTPPASIFGIPVLADVKGLPTGSWTRVLTSDMDRAGDQSVVFYDSKSRPIRNYLKNYLGGYTQTDSRIDFSGKTLYTVTEHRKGSSGTPIIVREDFTYSDQDRLLTHTHQINGGVVELLSKNEYDQLGQLVKKSVGRTANSPLQQADYSYNIRGWLTEINKTDDLNPQGGIADLFAFKINYNNIGNTLHSQINPLYNGNIAETYWKTSSDSHLRGYGYAYDNLNRLKSSFYHKDGLATGCYDESLSYDMNGNIQSLSRFGNSDGQNMALNIDELAYAYHPDKKNQLMKVFDSTNNFLGFDDDSPDGIADNDDDYDYDANGNMIKDQNKGITSVSYNHLNLPVRIIFNNDLNTKIDYIYRADGSKVQKKAFSYNPPPGNFGPISAVTEYMGGFQYKLGVLQFFPTSEGYVNNTSGSYSYVYNYLDHLGNIRLSYAQDPSNPGKLKIIEENHYYPFGLKHTNYNIDVLAFEKNNGNLVLRAPVGGPKPLAYQYKYNGKELQDELGLNMYDYGARNYDPAIGRWMNIDPLADERQMFSPYNYVQNNPIKRIDPNGMLDEWVKDGNDYVWDDRVTDQATAQQHHGSDATYIGKAATVTSTQGGKTLDSVSLNADGSVTKDGNTIAAGSDGAFNNAAGSSFKSRQTEGSSFSFGFDGALIGGFGVQVGLVNDAVGDTDFFINFNGNLGFGLFTGFSAGTVTPTGGNQFLTSDFAGNSSSYTAGVSTPVFDASWTPGGTIDSNSHAVDKMNPSNFGKTPRGYTTTQSGMGPGGAWGAGGMYSYGTTKTF